MASTLASTANAALLAKLAPGVMSATGMNELIGGGTPEIQLTIIASMILGLPRK